MSTMLRLGIGLARPAGCVRPTSRPDTEAINARANQEYIEAVAKFAKEATRFDGLDAARRPAAPAQPAAAVAGDGDAGRPEGGRGADRRSPRAMDGGVRARQVAVPTPGKPDACLDIEQITEIMAENREPKRLREVWEGWHTIAPPMRKDYAAVRRAGQQGRAASSASPTPARCGDRSTTCRPTRSPRRWTGCGSRSGRSTSRCTPTCA